MFRVHNLGRGRNSRYLQMRNFDLTSFLLGSLILALPCVYLLGKRHSTQWEVTASICAAVEQRHAEQINAMITNINVEEGDPQKKVGRR